MSANAATLIREIDDLLPQTQCRRCGYDGCRPYAEALVNSAASINLCPPGGESVRRALAAQLARTLEPAGPVHDDAPARRAEIIEADCIGCTKCIQVCPMDSIIGAAGYMHTVVAQWCTGCDLCAPVCPTDCISMPERHDAAPDAAQARARYTTLTQRERSPRRGLDLDYVDLQGVDRADLYDTVLAAVARKRAADE